MGATHVKGKNSEGWRERGKKNDGYGLTYCLLTHRKSPKNVLIIKKKTKFALIRQMKSYAFLLLLAFPPTPPPLLSPPKPYSTPFTTPLPSYLIKNCLITFIKQVSISILPPRLDINCFSAILQFAILSSFVSNYTIQVNTLIISESKFRRVAPKLIWPFMLVLVRWVNRTQKEQLMVTPQLQSQTNDRHSSDPWSYFKSTECNTSWKSPSSVRL